MNKNTILESNGMSIMDFLEKLLSEKKDKVTVLNSISFHFAGNPIYISDWRLKHRKNRIKEEYFLQSKKDKNQYDIYKFISKKLEKEFEEQNIDITITPRVVRHAVESA